MDFIPDSIAYLGLEIESTPYTRQGEFDSIRLLGYLILYKKYRRGGGFLSYFPLPSTPAPQIFTTVGYIELQQHFYVLIMYAFTQSGGGKEGFTTS